MTSKKAEPESYNAPWEKSFGKILTPLEDFIHKQSTAGKLLLACTVVALIFANSEYGDAFHHFLSTRISINIGNISINHDVHHWINDGLMAMFFFIVGLEIKRELLAGDLSNVRTAALPFFAAVGGMLIPALTYTLINTDPDSSHGWGIPMATDIAFAISILVLLGNRIPKALFTFLIAFAIIDDLGAVTVIALFYTETIHMNAFIVSIVFFLVLVGFNLGGIRTPLPYFIVGGFLWLALSESGIHATIAGIFTAWTVPTRPKIKPAVFSQQMRRVLDSLDECSVNETNIVYNDKQRALIQAIEQGIHKVASPLQRLEHDLHIPISLLILPIFALANAAIPITAETVSATFSQSTPISIILGLTLGKMVGITAFTLLAVKLGISTLPTGCNMKHIIGVSFLGGIGFTMSIFITDLAFIQHPELIDISKLAILVASILSGVAGLLWLRFIAADKQAVD